MKCKTVQLSLSLLLMVFWAASVPAEDRCKDYVAGQKNLYWGDLHVHTAYSLDAYAFGTTTTPDDAFAFAKGDELILPDSFTEIKLRRPLDFAAITDHAETFDIMYLCTNPNYSNSPYCKNIRNQSGTNQSSSLNVFKSYLLPLIAGKKPEPSPLCSEPGVDCEAAAQSQWQRIQRHANKANKKCEFSAFIGNEWSATPNSQHWHRNLIFSGSSVTRDAIDYINYPSPEKMWRALDEQCQADQGCNVIAIPHNTNLSEGGGFDVETSDDFQLQLRTKYERLIEIHQSKGNSECLTENWDNSDSDCGFEILFPRNGKKLAQSDPGYIEKLDRSYVRNILSRGLAAYKKSGEKQINPLQLGIIGSTDNHVSTPGATEENTWKGDAWGAGDKFKERRFNRIDYNPGGLVAVWSEENTRASIFQSLKSREVYGTSGTRIKLRFLANNNANKKRTVEENLCNASLPVDHITPMGGVIRKSGPHPPVFAVLAAQDSVPLSRIEIVKGTLKEGEMVETVYPLTENGEGFSYACKGWSDPDYDPSQPAYWYTRVMEIPTPRWSKTLCEEQSNCNSHPDGNLMIQERAWSSPIWYLP